MSPKSLDPRASNVGVSRSFPTIPAEQIPDLVKERTGVMGEYIRRTMEGLQETIPLWAVAERTENAITRKPDFVVYKYDTGRGSFPFSDHGFFKHTIVECKREEDVGSPSHRYHRPARGAMPTAAKAG